MGLGAIINANGTQATDLMEPGVIESIEIHERLGETTYYNLHFRSDIRDGDLALLTDGRIGPGADLAILVMNDQTLECLVKGPVFSQEITLRNGGDGTTVMVKGADASLAMDRDFRSATFEGTDSTAVIQIVGNYSMTPDVTSTNANHMETKHNLVQRATDLQFVRMLARRNGFKFWVTCDATTQLDTAHFKRPDLSADAGIELIINRQDYNVNELRISWDVHRPSTAEGLQLDLTNKQNIQGNVALSPETALGSMTQQAFSPNPITINLSGALDDSGDLTGRLEAALIESSYFVKANCETSVHQLGKVIRTATVVTLTGAGTQHSGKYLVSAVTHRIDESSHTMNVELIRNAVGPSV